MTTAKEANPTAALGQAFAVLHRLSVGAFRSPSRRVAIFRILNDTVRLVRYDRAALWLHGGRRPRLLGVSGQTEVKKGTELAEAWPRLVARIEPGGEPRTLDPEALGFGEKEWATVRGGREAVHILWVPLPVEKGPAAGLWLERTEASWSPAETYLLRGLAEGHGAALDRHAARWPARVAARRITTRVLLLAALIGIAHTLFVRTVRLKVVAPCEIVARDPFLVTAPLSGVVAEVVVEPGRAVSAGEVLFRYDRREAEEELEVARRQVEILTSQLDRATILALEGERTEGDIEILSSRLAQEEARLRLAAERVERLVVLAPVDGVVQMGPPHEWRGRPVRIGERVLLLVDPARTRVQILIPVEDNVPGLADNDIDVHLHAAPTRSIRARMTYLASDASRNRPDRTSYLGEADWVDVDQPPALGLQGTAVLHGEEVRVATWIFRKPVVKVRTLLGL